VSAGQVLAAVAAVAIAAVAIWRRRRLSRERLILFLVVAAGLGVYASGVLSALPDPKKAIGDVARALGPWTYALVGVFAYLETAAFVGLVAPGETVIIAGGVIAGQGEIELLPLIGLVWTCAVLGDTTSFLIGRRLGRPFLMRHGPRLGINEQRLEQVERYFARHGGKTILIGRFIGLVRALAPFVAGSSGLPYRRFIPFSVVGTGIWATTFCLLGYVFWQSFDKVANVAGHAVFAFGVVAGVIAGVVLAYRRLRHPEERRRLAAWLDRQGQRPLLRPLFALARPLWRRVLRPVGRLLWPRLLFLWERLTPGELGLGLTTSLAVGGVGLYFFVLFAVVVSGDAGPTPMDQQWFDLVDKLRSAAGVDAARLVSALGALPTALGLVAGISILLVSRRRPIELVALLVAFGLIVLAVHLAKAGVDRPRPTGALAHSVGSAYPSGHAAYSAAWVAAAVLVMRPLGLASRTTLLLTAIVISAAIGLARIYLRAHFWSDVAGGWGLGYGIFGLVATVALIVAYLRHNERVGAPRGR
jgi:membrane protein DedA with SNARE-associated domain/membrane-associated phospholipid phosphatase